MLRNLLLTLLLFHMIFQKCSKVFEDIEEKQDGVGYMLITISGREHF
ncbi:hypothetical protein [Bacillus cereus group sp. MYBK217-2]